MFKTQRADWLFIVPATLVWTAALVITVRDFKRSLERGSCRFGKRNRIGLGLMIRGVAMRLLARRALGKQFSYALRTLDDHVLVTRGIYRFMRHPAYTGDLLFQLGIPLLFSSMRGFLIMLLLIPCMVYRIRIEEEMLVSKFGDAYRDYQRRSKKLIPGVF